MSLHRFLQSPLPSSGETIELSADEAHHARAVLRLKDETQVELLDGEGRAVFATLRVQKKRVFARYEREGRTERPLRTRLVLVAAPLKSDAQHWLLEKAVELGVDEYVPLLTDNAVVKSMSVEKWALRADEALKQCGRLFRMTFGTPVDVEEWTRQSGPALLACHEDRKGPSLLQRLQEVRVDEIQIAVGPEGGWSPRENEILAGAGVALCSLGKNILRAETASLAAAAVLEVWRLNR